MMLEKGIYSYWKFVASEHRKTFHPVRVKKIYRAKRQGKAILAIVSQAKLSEK